jgi:hypothetical protein
MLKHIVSVLGPAIDHTPLLPLTVELFATTVVTNWPSVPVIFSPRSFVLYVAYENVDPTPGTIGAVGVGSTGSEQDARNRAVAKNRTRDFMINRFLFVGALLRGKDRLWVVIEALRARGPQRRR